MRSNGHILLMSENRQRSTPRAVVIADYDPGWPELFRAEERLLRETSGGLLNPVEHVGSTSVPGLAAKPVIDIMGGVRKLSDADALIEPLEAIGYQYIPTYEDQLPDRRYFRKPGRAEGRAAQFHLHVVEVGGDFWVRLLLFRQYLRSQPAVADEYASLKRRLAAQYGTDRLGYSEAKTDMILSILSQARSGRPSA